MSTISRYLLSQFLKFLGLCLGSFVAIYLIIDFLEKYNRFARGSGDVSQMLLFFLYKIPEIIGQVMPLAALMATLLTLGLMARNSEITALKGCGISLVRIATPLMGTALILSILMFLNNEFVIPSSYREMRQVERILEGKQGSSTFFRQNNIWYRQDNLILQARLFDAAAGTLTGLTIWENGGSGQPTARIDAKTANLKGEGWLLHDVTITRFTDAGLAGGDKMPTLSLPLALQSEDLKVVDKYADNMGFLQLRDYADKLQRGGYDPTRIQAQMHAKLALPLASLVMAFLGIPFSLRGGRSSGIAMGIGVSLLIGFIYFLVNAILVSFGQTGVLSPLAAAWSANLIFAATGLWLILTVDA
jgi:lipopolysaccharide export system permease protein